MSEKPGLYQVRVEGSDTFQCNNDDSLLTTLERNNIDVHYHCREGYCGACRTKLVSGTVEYLTDPLAFIDDDEVLPCCCRPTSHIEIKLHL